MIETVEESCGRYFIQDQIHVDLLISLYEKVFRGCANGLLIELVLTYVRYIFANLARVL
jgi:hypothetical protein